MLSNKIKAKRILLGLKTKEMSDKLGISNANYLKYENNSVQIPSNKLLKIFELLDIQINYNMNI